MSVAALVLDAPAKVNLYLAVLGRRDDGYHEVETILHEIELHDTLIAAKAEEGVRLEIAATAGSGLPVDADGDNLVCRAARAFFAASGAPGGARFHLTKRIPAGGGLGGGSSDAATALLLLDELYETALGADGLHEIAAQLGADIPFFLRGGTQLGRGTGTELVPLAQPGDLHFLLLLPATGTSTAAIYKNHGPHLTLPGARTSILVDQVPAVEEVAVATGFPNDLEPSALQLHPELAALREQVVALNYPQVRMSGSGSTFFIASVDDHATREAKLALAPLARAGVRLLRTRSSQASRTPRPGVFPGVV